MFFAVPWRVIYANKISKLNELEIKSDCQSGFVPYLFFTKLKLLLSLIYTNRLIIIAKQFDFMSVFNDDLQKINIEVGSGRGDFGQRYYPHCYLTDFDQSLKSLPDNKIDCYCNADNLVYWGNDRFEKIISCNPYGYGFDEVQESENLLDEFIRVLKNNGKIIIIGSDRNKYCAPERVRKRINNYIGNKSNLHLQFTVIDIDANRDYSNYKFWTSDGYETVPNKKIEINVTK